MRSVCHPKACGEVSPVNCTIEVRVILVLNFDLDVYSQESCHDDDYDDDADDVKDVHCVLG